MRATSEAPNDTSALAVSIDSLVRVPEDFGMPRRDEEPVIKVLTLQAHDNGVNSSKREEYFSANLYRQDSLTQETNFDQFH